jgi:hypothetical protein
VIIREAGSGRGGAGARGGSTQNAAAGGGGEGANHKVTGGRGRKP